MKPTPNTSAREYSLIAYIAVVFPLTLFFPSTTPLLWIGAVAGSLPTLFGALKATAEKRISIDTFNLFALIVSFAYGEVRSAVFIVLMLTFARLLNTYTESRTRHTLEELLKLKPQTALRETNGVLEEVPTDTIASGDLLVIKEGARIPVDGLTVFGSGLVSEASVTGESAPIEKVSGDHVLSSTINLSGVLKIKATRVGKDSTIERMAKLVEEASKNKSRSERLADRFATLYLPMVLVLGAVTYFSTGSAEMTAALFLVACADDMAVAIPLAIAAALGRAAKRGVVIKGGEWIDTLSRLHTVVLDKTGTLTFGAFTVKEARIESGTSPSEFWSAVALAEKFSEHPIGRMLFKAGLSETGVPPDPEYFKVYKGDGVTATYDGHTVAVGDYDITKVAGITLGDTQKEYVKKTLLGKGVTRVVVIRDSAVLGFISVGDVPRPEAKASLEELRRLGIRDIRMFSGDTEVVARDVGSAMGITLVVGGMTPESKLRELEKLLHASSGPVAMVGDGVNDAASLARADIGIAMGGSGAAVSVEAADMVVLNDDLSRLPEMVAYSRKVMSVIRWDMIIWFVSNIVGIGLVFTGFLSPALAAFYNFVSDFFPLINSARLFRGRKGEEGAR